MEALCKLSPQRQITIPHRLWEAMDRPTHLRAQIMDDPSEKGGRLVVMWPARVLTLAEQARRAGIPPEVLREARRIVEERKTAGGAKGAPPPLAPG